MKTLQILLLMLGAQAFSQKMETTTLLKDKISIRAIEVVDDKVWYSGTDAKFGYVSLKDTLDKKQIRISEKPLQFRTLAYRGNCFYLINVESPAYFYKVNKLSFETTILHTDADKNAFYDALYLHKKKFYSFSDPESDLKLKLASFYEKKSKFHLNYIQNLILKDGEAAFAASNTNISGWKNKLWIATGGKASRIILADLKTNLARAVETPFVQGSSSQGIYSIDFYKDQFGIAVGGDYTKQAENTNNIATTTDGGEIWQIQASGKNGGYKTCVKIRPGSKGKEIIAIGDQNIEFSSDYGKTWRKLSDEKGLYACAWSGRNTLVLAGKDRIVKMDFK